MSKDLPRGINPIARDILTWYSKNKRSLPWRDNPKPYWVLLSEFMLQQTQVETVKPYFSRFIADFPTLHDLACASEDEVMRLWAGLGYYSRARNLLRTAVLIDELESFPSEASDLVKLPGIGDYMSGAISSIAFGKDEAAVDGNHHRVFSRLFRDSGKRAVMWKYGRELLPTGKASEFNQALMDLGTSICTSKSPKCSVCPIATHCMALEHDDVLSFPKKKKKKKKPTKLMVSAIFSKKNEVLLGRRPSSGLFGGLYEPPTFFVDGHSTENLKKCWVDNFGTEIEVECELGQVKHTLTHMHLDVLVYRVSGSPPESNKLYTQFVYKNPLDLKGIGVSTLAKKILKSHTEPSQMSLFDGASKR